MEITSPEDIVLQKLDGLRKGGESSEQQWRDLTGLLRTRGADLDQVDLDAWAERVQLAPLLPRARRDAAC